MIINGHSFYSFIDTAFGFYSERGAGRVQVDPETAG